jgi:hypothetical protein
MEPNKFEDNIKEKLEDRTLQPSNDAWNKLATRLEAKEEKRNNKAFWWLGIAASFIGFLFIASQFFNDEKPVEPKVSDVPSVIQQKENIEVAAEKSTESNAVLNEEQSIKSSETNLLKVDKIAIKKEHSELAFEELKDTNKIYKVEKLIDLSKEKLTFEEQKIQDVVAKINDLKNNNKTITDADIDALLLEAQKEIRFQKMQTQVAGAIDAAKLLEEVEADLDQSFRSKVLEAIRAAYGNVKTAVAQRNN